jgi:hypothetical protein
MVIIIYIRYHNYGTVYGNVRRTTIYMELYRSIEGKGKGKEGKGQDA